MAVPRPADDLPPTAGAATDRPGTGPARPVLSARGLTLRFGRGAGAAAVEGADLDLAPGEFLALVGPSGAGKTTLLRLLAGFELPQAGHVSLRGRDVTATPAVSRGIGFVFQDLALFPHLSAADNVGFGLTRQPRPAAAARVAAMLDLVGLGGLGDRFPHQLSGGQQQRVALARALAPAPGVVLLDEPFSGLDAGLRRATARELRAILRQTGAAGVLVTHDREEALALADRIAVMHDGRIVQIGGPSDLYARPANAFVARFLGEANLVPAEAAGGEAISPLGRLALDTPRQGSVRLAIRPEQLEPRPDPAGPGEVLWGEFCGASAMHRVGLNGLTLDCRTAGLPLPPGTRVGLRVTGPVHALGTQD